MGCCMCPPAAPTSGPWVVLWRQVPPPGPHSCTRCSVSCINESDASRPLPPHPFYRYRYICIFMHACSLFFALLLGSPGVPWLEHAHSLRFPVSWDLPPGPSSSSPGLLRWSLINRTSPRLCVQQFAPGRATALCCFLEVDQSLVGS